MSLAMTGVYKVDGLWRAMVNDRVMADEFASESEAKAAVRSELRRQSVWVPEPKRIATA